MTYTSNSDVFYKRKKNPYRGPATTGHGYGYSKSGIADLLKAFTGNSRRMRLGPKSGPRSKVKFNRKRKADSLREEGPANAMTYTNFGKRKSWVEPTLLKISAPEKYIINKSTQLTCGVGVQAVWTQPLLNNSGDVATLLAKGPTGGTTNTRMFIEGVYGQYTFSNQSAATAECIIYDCIARRDVAVAAVADPWAAWLQGVTDEGLATGTTTVGATPFNVEAFTKYWRVVRRTPFNIGPGGVHRHRISYSPNKVISGAEIAYSAFASAGLAIASLMVWHGQPAHDSTTKTQVSTAAINLDMVSELEYTCKFIQNNALNVTRTNNLVAAFTVGQEEFNEDLGELQNAAGLAAGTLVA